LFRLRGFGFHRFELGEDGLNECWPRGSQPKRLGMRGTGSGGSGSGGSG
jgi:hypothetical protein